LKVVAETLGMTSLRLSIDCHQDGDPVTIQHSHGQWRDAERSRGSVEIRAGSAIVKIEYHCNLSVSEVEIEQLKQALEVASACFSGEPSGAKALPTEGSHQAG
jgi:hypothetical protein